MARQARDAHRRRARPPRRDLRRARCRAGAAHRWRAPAPTLAHRRRRPGSPRSATATDRDDDQRHRSGPAGRDRWRPPDWTGSTSASTPSTRAEFADLTRRDRLHDVEAGLEAAREAGLIPVKVNAVAMRGINDHSVADLLAVVPRAWLRAAVHRADAARRPARLGRQHDDRRRRDPRRGSSERFTITPLPGRRAGECPGRALPRRRWPGHGRHHRECHGALLRGLRPHPAHRRRPGAQLPVLAARDRPARPDA